MFLSHLLSWQAAVTGLFVTLAVMPLSMWLGKRQGQLRGQIMKCTDARVKLTSEVLTGDASSQVLSTKVAGLPGHLHSTHSMRSHLAVAGPNHGMH